MTSLIQLSEDYHRVEQAIRYLEENMSRQPTLAEVADHVGLSEYHFQRLFTRWAGISPKRFLQFLTKETAKTLLAHNSVLASTMAAGLSSPGRLHDLFVHTEAVTPGQFKSRGKGLKISYGFQPSPFGECLMAATAQGICYLAFTQEGDREKALSILYHDWSCAQITESPSRTAPLVHQVFARSTTGTLTLHLQGTNFQLKVWEALLRISPGEVTTYQAIASRLQAPLAGQAVGNAIACNPVAYLIPCHRVLRKIGGFGQYRYGSQRKIAMLMREDIYRL